MYDVCELELLEGLKIANELRKLSENDEELHAAVMMVVDTLFEKIDRAQERRKKIKAIDGKIASLEKELPSKN